MLYVIYFITISTKEVIIIRITYTYKKFQNYPEATEISRSREESRVYQFLFIIAIFFLSICTIDSKDYLFAICGIIISIIWIIYLFSFYNKKTDLLIEDAKKRDIERQKSAEERKSELKKVVYTVGEDISAGVHTFISTNALGGMVHIFSSKGKPIDRIYVKNKKKIKLKVGMSIKVFDCIVDSI